MRIELRTAMIAAALMAGALSAAAETAVPTIAHDPLMNQIMSRQLTLPAGGVTGSTRLGSGEAITLNMIDPLAPLRPAEGLVEKPAVKAKAVRKVRRTVDQLRKMSRDDRRADWSGRK
jgi:hypothetical protein